MPIEIQDRKESIKTEAKEIKQNKIRILGGPISLEKISLRSSLPNL